MKISLKIMLLDVHNAFYRPVIQENHFYDHLLCSHSYTYNLARKEFRATIKFCAECLYKRPRKEQVAFDIFTLCMIYCFTPKKSMVFAT